ncbi:MAG: YfhO family protein, partial [Phycisphaerae bacterium]|nr:YfhO family protein [Phycisphaerae bacterium]
VLMLAGHGWDLWRHNRLFLQPPIHSWRWTPRIEEMIIRMTGNQRVAIDIEEMLALNRMLDDVGFFDSIILANPYRALLRMEPRLGRQNIQQLNGSQLRPETLAHFGARLVVTRDNRPDLPKVLDGVLKIYQVPGATARASWVDYPLRPGIEYRRPHPDQIELSLTSETGGRVQVLEAFDPGWSARIDGQPAPVEMLRGFALGVTVPPGKHEVVFRYHTPGKSLGIIVSLTAAGALGLLCLTTAPAGTPRVQQASSGVA